LVGRAGIYLVLLFTAGFLLGGCQKTSDAVFGARVRSYLLKHPEVLEEAINQLAANQAKAQVEHSRQAINRYRGAIERDPRDFVANPNGKITVTEFYDYNCTYCKAAAPKIVALIRNNPDVRFVFKEYPVLGEDSVKAAALALAARDQGQSMTLYQRFYSVPGHLDETGMEAGLLTAGLNVGAIKSKAISESVQKHLADNHALGSQIGIEGTPNFVVGNQIVVGADMDKLMAAINQVRQAKS
jgi:protein-disulfide isomerase